MKERKKKERETKEREIFFKMSKELWEMIKNEDALMFKDTVPIEPNGFASILVEAMSGSLVFLKPLEKINI